MWTLVALFCNITEPRQGVCESATPPFVFTTREACLEFAVAASVDIPFDKVSYDYQCVSWQKA